MRIKRKSGFTLIELLVVVIIIGILAAIAVPVYLNQRVVAWKSTVVSDVSGAELVMEKMVSGITTSSYKDSGTSSTGVVSAAYTVSASDTDDASIAGTLYDNSTGSEPSATMSNGDRISISNGNKLYIQVNKDVNKDDGWYRIQGSNVNVPGWKYEYTSSTGKGEWAVGDIDTGSGSDSNNTTTSGRDSSDYAVKSLITTNVAGLKVEPVSDSDLSVVGTDKFTATCGSNPYVDYKDNSMHFRYAVKITNTTSSRITDYSITVNTSGPPFFGYQPLTDDLSKENLSKVSSDSTSITVKGTNGAWANGYAGMSGISGNNGYTIIFIDMYRDENTMDNSAVKEYALEHESTTDNISSNETGKSSITVVNDSPYQLPVYVKSADGNGIFSGTNPVSIKAHDTVATGWVSYTKS